MLLPGQMTDPLTVTPCGHSHITPGHAAAQVLREGKPDSYQGAEGLFPPEQTQDPVLCVEL